MIEYACCAVLPKSNSELAIFEIKCKKMVMSLAFVIIVLNGLYGISQVSQYMQPNYRNFPSLLAHLKVIYFCRSGIR